MCIRILRNNIRIMRNTTLDALFPGIRQAILGSTLLQPTKWWYLSELAAVVGTTPSSLQRELASLVRAGIIERREDGRRVYFRAERRSPIFSDLKHLLEKTSGVSATLRDALASNSDGIELAFLYGSVARGEEHATSDVDLMLIGSARLAELTPALRRAETQIGRAINVTHYSTPEFRSKLKRKDHFLNSVMKGKLLFIKGGRRDLGKFAGKGRGEAA